MAPLREILDLRLGLGGSLIEPTWSPALRQAVQGQPEHSLEARRHEQFPLLFQGGPALHQAVQGQPEHSLEARRHEQFPHLLQGGPALHQKVPGQGVVNPRIVDPRWGCSLASRLRGSTTARPKSYALGITAAGPSRPTPNGFAASNSVTYSRRSP